METIVVVAGRARVVPRMFDFRYDIWLPATGFLLLALFAWLYVFHYDTYTQLLTYWMLAPFRFPFLDLASIQSNIECWQKGLDVYVYNPCDVLHRSVYSYSPLLLRLGFLPTDLVSTMWLGLIMVGMYFLSLGLLPRPYGWWNKTLVVLGAYASLPVFGVERANFDLLVFIAAVVTARCMAHSLAVRVLGYAVVMLSGLQKLYPFVLFLGLIRERLRAALVIGSVAIAGILIFAWWYRLELPRVLHNLPEHNPLIDNWGAVDLPLGIGRALPPVLAALHLDISWLMQVATGRLLKQILMPAMTLCAVGGAIFIAFCHSVRAALAEIPDQARWFLLLGATLVVSCFFADPNVGYRGVHLLLVLPCLLGLGQAATDKRARRLFNWTAYATVYVLWMLTIQFVVAAIFGGEAFPIRGPAIGFAFWFLREFIWWWIVTVLMGVLFRLALESPFWRDLTGMMGWRRKRPVLSL